MILREIIISLSQSKTFKKKIKMTIKSNINSMGAITVNNRKTRSMAKMYSGTNERNSNYWNTKYPRDRNLHIEISTHVKRNK